MKAVSFLCALLLMQVSVSAATIHVPKDYAKIQEAIEASQEGDTIVVGAGTYYEEINYKGKNVIVKSSQGPESTVIDAQKNCSVVTFNGGEVNDAVLDGFTLTNVYWYKGGGIFCSDGSSPTVRNNIITNNEAAGPFYSDGGGIYCIDSSPIILNNVISHNKVTPHSTHPAYGGGIYCVNASPVIQGNIISNNTGAHNGGGIYAWWANSPVIQDNVIHGNAAEWQGGGIFCWASDSKITNNFICENTAESGGGLFSRSYESIAEDNLFLKNSAVRGGGIYFLQAAPLLFGNNTITENMADHYGGGIYCDGYGLIQNNRIEGNRAGLSGGGVFLDERAYLFVGNQIHGNSARNGGGLGMNDSNAMVYSNIIYDNHASMGGGGIHIDKQDYSHPYIVNNTVFKNKAHLGGGLWSEGYVTLEIVNTIFWSNLSTDGMELRISISNNTSTLEMRHCNIEGGLSAMHVDPGVRVRLLVGTINADPCFLDPDHGDLHLQYHSPCRDTGFLFASHLPEIDFENDPRIVYGRVDMGADEFHTHLYHTGNIVPGGHLEIKITDKPDTQPLILWVGTCMKEEPVNTSMGWWYLELPILFELDLGRIPSNGVRQSFFRIPTGFPSPLKIPLQALSGASLTNLSVIDI